MGTTPYPTAQAVFYQQYDTVRRDEVVGILLALFLGCFGAHHFYLRRKGLGILYLCFFWTGITAFLGFIECFFMPGRVREFNAIQAAAIAATLGMSVPAWGWPVNVNINVPPAASAGPFAGAPFAAAQPVSAQTAGTALTPAETLVACPRCQTPNIPGARFCSACGQVLS